MPVEKIKFGKPYPSVDSVELRDGISSGILNGFQDESESIISRPGLTSFIDNVSAHPIDGFWESEIFQKVVIVSGGKVYHINTNGSLGGPYVANSDFLIGTPVIFCEDSRAIYAANGGYIHKIDCDAQTANTLGTSSPNYVTHVVWSQGFLLCNGQMDGGVAGDIYFSTDSVGYYNNTDSWLSSGSGGFWNNEAHPDGCTALMVDRQEVHAFGPTSIEVNKLNTDGNWYPYPGTNPTRGILAPYSLVKFDKSFYFLSVIDSAVRIVTIASDGREPVSVSNPYDSVIQTLTDYQNAKAWGISYNGRRFYVITFPDDDFTLAYNLDQDQWNQWSFYNDGTDEAHLMNAYIFSKYHRQHYVGSREDTGNIYTLGGFTDDGVAINCQYTTGHISHGTDRLKRPNRILWKVKRGQATDTSEPRFTVELRKNGEGNFRRVNNVSLGFAGEKEFFARMAALGAYRQMQFRFTHRDLYSDFILVTGEEEFDVLGN